MIFFKKDFLDFLSELKEHNSKEWFDENRARYIKSVKEPFAQFVADLIRQIQAHDPNLIIDAKDCILRINRDIRFSKDKTPYNPYVTAFISKGGRKDKSAPGIFFRFTPTELGIMAGCFMPDKVQLQKIRESIIADPKAFDKIISTEKFKDKFEDLKGEEAKRMPSEWKELAEKYPILKKKQFHVTAILDSKHILSADLENLIMEYWHAARPLNLFLENAIQK